MANKNPNIGPLLKSIGEKQQRTFDKVEETLKNMIKKQLKINFNSVAEESGVSKSFLYKYNQIRDRIETLRKQQEGLDSPRQVRREMTEQSKDVIIASLKERNKKLEEENKKLREQLKMNFADVYNQI